MNGDPRKDLKRIKLFPEKPRKADKPARPVKSQPARSSKARPAPMDTGLVDKGAPEPNEPLLKDSALDHQGKPESYDPRGSMAEYLGIGAASPDRRRRD